MARNPNKISQIQVGAVTYDIYDANPAPQATYTNSTATITASATGWKTTPMNTLESSVGTLSDYVTWSNGVLTAVVACVVEVSAHFLWRGRITGNYGLDFYDGTTERSICVTQTTTSNDWQALAYTPRLFRLTAGNTLTLRRYDPSDAVFYGADRSWVTFKVVS